MIQEQNAQTINLDNNLIEQVNEQELNEEKLQDITGGCMGCGVLALVTSYETSRSLSKGNVPRAIAQFSISLDCCHSLKNSMTRNVENPQRLLRPCANCIVNTALYGATKGISKNN
jgi:hypothetical protein